MSFTDENGKRRREPASASWDESQELLRDRLRIVKERKNLKPGEVPPCWESFADVADRYLAYQKPRLSPPGYARKRALSCITSSRSSPAS